MVPEREVWSLVEFPEVSPGVRSMFLLAQRQVSIAWREGGREEDGISSSKKTLEERRGGMRPVHQVGGRAHSSY